VQECNVSLHQNAYKDWEGYTDGGSRKEVASASDFELIQSYL